VQSIQISFDTLQPQLFSSLNAGSEKDHQSILDNLSYAIQSPLRVVVSSVLSSANAHEVNDIMLYCYDLGIDSYTLYPNVPAKRENTDLIIPISRQLDFINDLIQSYQKVCPTRIIDLSIPCFQFSDVYHKWKDRISIRLHPCGAGQFNLKITSEGMVSTCICQDADEFIVGNLYDSDLDEIWSSPQIMKFRSIYKDIPSCIVCQFQSVCRGGCRNQAFSFGKYGIYSNDLHCEFFQQSQ
jgi:radical SAM protein with 4Fe4S-binding SPASM domain